MWIWTALAHAIEPAPLLPPTGLPPTLFDRAGLIEVRATSETPTCEAARDALLAKAQELGEKADLRVVLALYPMEGISQAPLTHVSCKLTGIPDAPSGAAAEAQVLMVHPGYGFPNVPAARQAELIGLLAAVHGVTPDTLGLKYEEGRIWVDAGVREHEAILGPQLTMNARGVAALQEHVIPWVTRWAPLTSQVPEVAGAILSVRVRSEAEKGKRKELFVYRADAPSAAAFTMGRTSDEDWVLSLPVAVIDEGGKSKGSSPLRLDLEDASGSVKASGRKTIGGDLSDLEDL